MPTLSCSSGHQGVPCVLLPAQCSLSWLVSVICPSVLAGDTTEMFPPTTLVKGMCLTDSSAPSRHHNCSGLSAFGEDFYLHLAPDARFIAPAFAAQYLGTAPGAARPRPGLRHCFYSGDVNGDRESFAALSLCGGLRGAFGYRGAEYTISPLPGGAAGGAHRLQAGGAPGGRAKRFASVPRYVETLVVADESMVKFHGDDLQHYLLTLMATAARLYKHPSIRNPIQISVVKFLLIGQDDKGPKVTGNAALTLRNFCAWQKKWNKVSDKHPEYWDTAILFTKQV
uniref:Peptidase M12B propeptide domain-containing protein n=1 Tax=Anas platyrhynchos platyrhynchos TaxID=8840 RepID=A0A493TQP7_ANAPP